jgi:hypothetical protein
MKTARSSKSFTTLAAASARTNTLENFLADGFVRVNEMTEQIDPPGVQTMNFGALALAPGSNCRRSGSPA